MENHRRQRLSKCIKILSMGDAEVGKVGFNILLDIIRVFVYLASYMFKHFYL